MPWSQVLMVAGFLSDTSFMATLRTQPARTTAMWQHVAWIMCAVVVTALMGANWLRSSEPRTVSDVKLEIQSVVLQSPKVSMFPEGGGIIGPWHVVASDFDAENEVFHDFRLRSGAINLGASRAVLLIDVERNSFSFELHDVVIFRLPQTGTNPDDPNHLIRMDSFLLGPAKYHRPIVPDSSTG